MASPLRLVLFLITVTYSFIFSDTLAADSNDLKTYIVYMGDLPKTDHFSVASLHTNMLQQVTGSRASKSLLWSYKRSFNGFVAKLTEYEKNQLARMEGVVSVFPSRKKQLHTTRSWDFMGFPQDIKRASLESDVIVGMLDTGVWPESDSFKDDGFGPPPAKWKGSCTSTNFTCNKKLIGAKYYNTESEGRDKELSARDTEGHGTHTASTVAGRAVNNASLLGLANGTARGGVPSARIAVYKICFPAVGCSDADILAAFDDAIADGVDIISLSVGGSFPSDYFEDPIAIGAFHSMKNGILTSNSAGNNGPSQGSITNVSPWSLSVAASSIDRKFLTQIVLGNNMTYQGPAINTFDGVIHLIVYGASVPNTKKGFTSADSRYCEADSLDPTLVQNKIVVCEDLEAPANALQSGASGVVIDGDFGYEDFAFSYPLSTTYLSSKDGKAVLSYINSTTTPSANILKSIEPVDKAAPTVVSFSSRGPNLITLDVLKPDLTAPGVDILAAWSQATVTGDEGDTRVVPFNIISGTSMSCPHATGAAAYVKSFHPTWSPAAIKSALMTTAAPMNPTKNSDAEFAYGSGHIDPSKAIDPGLVYDAGEQDFVSFLCGQGYNATTLKMVTGDSSACSAATNATVWDLNYPSFALSAKQSGSISRTFNRTVTNVGASNSLYQANVVAPSGMAVKVNPSSLAFKAVGEMQSFVVTVDVTIGSNALSGKLVWSDGGGFETTTDHVQSHDGDGFDGEDSGGEDHVDATTHYESNDTSMPVDNSRKPLITVVGRKFGDIKVHKAIGVMFSRSFDASWTTYRHVPRATVGIVHDLFRDTYTFDPTVDSEHSIRVAFENVLKDRFPDIMEHRVSSAKKARAAGFNIGVLDDDFDIMVNYPPDKMSANIWQGLCSEWNTDEWRKKAETARNNRKGKDSSAMLSRHTGGSIGFDEHRIRLTCKLKRPPTHTEVFLDTHLTKECKRNFWAGLYDESMEGMEFCTDRAKQIFEAYQSSMVEKYGEDTTQYPLGDVELWEHASGGRRFGIGSSDIHFVMTGTQASSTGSTPFYGSQHEMQELMQQQVKEEVERQKIELKKEMMEEMQQQKERMEEMQQQMAAYLKQLGNPSGNPPP